MDDNTKLLFDQICNALQNNPFVDKDGNPVPIQYTLRSKNFLRLTVPGFGAHLIGIRRI